MSRLHDVALPFFYLLIYLLYVFLSQHVALDTRFYAQGRANEMDCPICGKDEHTGRADAV